MSEVNAKTTVSIVVPFHNEEGNVTELYARLHTVMESTNWGYQFVFVDDGSADHTFKLLSELAEIDPHVTVVRLRRNFGQTAALAAGFTHSNSEYVIAMDGDLQHNPGEIPRFLEKLEEGYDIVSGWRKRRIDNLWLRKIPSRCANWLMAKLSGVDIHDFGTTFKAYRRELLSQLPLYGEMHRFIPALASWYGASICEIPIQNDNRKHGVSHYNLSRTFRVLFDLITIRFLLQYMSRPLHFFGQRVAAQKVSLLHFFSNTRPAISFYEKEITRDELRRICSSSSTWIKFVFDRLAKPTTQQAGLRALSALVDGGLPSLDTYVVKRMRKAHAAAEQPVGPTSPRTRESKSITR
jgi:glycosyltransferase involved in cell wall biosynthesis